MGSANGAAHVFLRDITTLGLMLLQGD